MSITTTFHNTQPITVPVSFMQMDTNESNISRGSVWRAAQWLIDRCFSAAHFPGASIHDLLNNKYFMIMQNVVALFWFIKCDTQNMRLKNTPNSTRLYHMQVHSNIFCKWKIPQYSTDRGSHVCVMLLCTKPSQYLRRHSSHPSDTCHIPCYSVPTAVGQFGKNV